MLKCQARNEPTAILFLDCDGVLNTVLQTRTAQDLDPDRLARLRQIIEAVPGTCIVLSTSWRAHPHMLALLRQRLTEAGISPALIIGKTPNRPLPRQPQLPKLSQGP